MTKIFFYLGVWLASLMNHNDLKEPEEYNNRNHKITAINNNSISLELTFHVTESIIISKSVIVKISADEQ